EKRIALDIRSGEKSGARNVGAKAIETEDRRELRVGDACFLLKEARSLLGERVRSHRHEEPRGDRHQELDHRERPSSRARWEGHLGGRGREDGHFTSPCSARSRW